MKQTEPRTLAQSQTENLLAHLAKLPIPYAKQQAPRRNYCMALLMLDAGLRVGELVQLLQGDLWFAGDVVQVLIVRAEIAKRKHARTIPLTPRLRKAIATLRNLVWALHTYLPGFYAFYQHDPHRHLTVRQVERIIGYAGLATVGWPVHPHILRHTFATRVLRKSNIRVTQQLLGHSSLQSTQIYTHPNSDDQKAAIAAMDCEQPEPYSQQI